MQLLGRVLEVLAALVVMAALMLAPEQVQWLVRVLG